MSPVLQAPLTPDASLLFVGALAIRADDGSLRPRCTATLVTRERVLTAKHCVLGNGNTPLDLSTHTLMFSIGPDMDAPLESVPVSGIELAPPLAGGFTGLGSDLAVLRLAHSVVAATPVAAIATSLSTWDANAVYSTYGYGASNADEEQTRALAGQRRGGVQTLRAVRGNLFKEIYGSYERFAAAMRGEERSSSTNACDAETQPTPVPTARVHQLYERGTLQEGLEAWAGADAEEPQTCFGDSGGPLLMHTDAGPRLVGVVSWSWRSQSSACAFGTVYALLTPAVLSILGAR